MDASPQTVVAICAATGRQGQDVVSRVLAAVGAQQTSVRALTRNAAGPGAAALRAMEGVSIVQADYSSDSLKGAFEGCDAVFINCALAENEAEVYRQIVDAAVDVKVGRLVFSSTIDCDGDHSVPHWITSYQIEQYIKEKHAHAADQGFNFQYYFLRLGHVNENVLPGSYFAPKRGHIEYPWSGDIPNQTCSNKDIARAAAALLLGRCSSFGSGSHIDAVTETFTPKDFATAISAASGVPVYACRGPWMFLTFGHWFGWEASSILTMAEHMERRGGVTSGNLAHLPALLREEIEAEPLETIMEFAARHFKDDKSIGPSYSCC